MVYFIQGHITKLIKIGWANSPTARFDNLQCGSPDKLQILKEITTEKESERYLHTQFKELRVHGEWFYPGDRLLKLIAAVPKAASTAIIAELLADESKQADMQKRDSDYIGTMGIVVERGRLGFVTNAHTD